MKQNTPNSANNAALSTSEELASKLKRYYGFGKIKAVVEHVVYLVTVNRNQYVTVACTCPVSS